MNPFNPIPTQPNGRKRMNPSELITQVASISGETKKAVEAVDWLIVRGLGEWVDSLDGPVIVLYEEA